MSKARSRTDSLGLFYPPIHFVRWGGMGAIECNQVAGECAVSFFWRAVGALACNERPTTGAHCARGGIFFIRYISCESDTEARPENPSEQYC
jgi:hypothetical protein